MTGNVKLIVTELSKFSFILDLERESWREKVLTLCAVQPRPAGRTLTLAIISTAERPVVAVTSVDAVRTPLTWRTRYG